MNALPIKADEGNLMVIRINEVFPCLFFTVKSLNLLFGNRDKDKRKLCKRKRQR